VRTHNPAFDSLDAPTASHQNIFMSRIASCLVFSALSALAGCSGESSSPAASVSDYAFYSATRAADGYDVRRVNEPGAAVHVRAIDLAPGGLAAFDVATILGEVGSDPSAARLLFVGKVVGDALTTYEVWRGSREAKLDASAFHVSHRSSQALAIGAWQSMALRKLDLDGAPTVAECDDAKNPACAPSHDGVVEDANSPSGIVAVGTLADGTIHARDWFVKLVVGHQHRSDGYGYCAAGQTSGSSGVCIGTPSIDGVLAPSLSREGRGRGVIHWDPGVEPKGRGRGLIGDDPALEPEWHGGGLDPQYVRTFAPAVRSWFVVTTQLRGDEADLP